jgi:alanyl aminopeptidase
MKVHAPHALALCVAASCGHRSAPAPLREADTHRATAVVPASPAESVPIVRLPQDEHPTREALVLHVDPAKERFSGVADIDVHLDHTRSVVWVHGLGLHVTRATATDSHGVVQAGEWRDRTEGGIASITFASALPAGDVTIHVEYDARFVSNVEGPFGLQGVFTVMDGGVPYAFTYFEPVSARKAFPCFDEPGSKITFDLTLVVPRSAVAIANTPEVARSEAGDMTRVRFAPTPPLSPYLVAFAVGPLDVVAGPDIAPNVIRRRPVPLRGITTRGHGKDFAYALARAREIVSTLEEYAGVEYPYEKLDLLAVPERPSAMENAGAITMNAAEFLWDGRTASPVKKHALVRALSHELAHQWVGDLVTPAFWDETFLKEGLAEWLGTRTAEAVAPDTHASALLLANVQAVMMGEDSTAIVRSLRQPIASDDDIHRAFDSITYMKGGGILTMFEDWVGPEPFRRGLHDYLGKHRFASATSEAFVAAESAAAGQDLSAPFASFLDQPGVPLLDAEVMCNGSPRLHLKQSRYRRTGSPGGADEIWQIPICVRYGASGTTARVCALLKAREGDVPLGNDCPDWVFPNADATGYFRFSLSPTDLADLRARGFSRLTPRERAALGNSLDASYGAGTLSMADALAASSALASDPDESVAEYPMKLLRDARDWLPDSQERADFEAYAQWLFRPVLRRLGWDPVPGEDEHASKLRASVIQFLALTADDPSVRVEAKRRALSFLGDLHGHSANPAAIDPSLLGTSLRVLGREGNGDLFDALLSRFVKSSDPERRTEMLVVLSSVQAPSLLPRARELVWRTDVRPQEKRIPIWEQLESPATREAAWNWLKDSFDQLDSALPSLSFIFPALERFCDEVHANDIEAFFTRDRTSKIDHGARLVASTVENVRLCAARRQTQEPSARHVFVRAH